MIIALQAAIGLFIVSFGFILRVIFFPGRRARPFVNREALEQIKKERGRARV